MPATRLDSIVFAAVCGLLLVGCDNSKPSEGSAQNLFAERITAASHGCLKLVDFSKTDGQASEVNGVATYTINYNATVLAVKSCRLTGVYDAKPEAEATINDLQLPSLGETRQKQFSGTLTFERSDNGWKLAN